MPELPEVEVLRRDLEREVVGRTIAGAKVQVTPNSLRIIRRHAACGELEGPLTGARITGIRRRGKYLLFDLDFPGSGVGEPGPDLALIVHLGMSGQLLHEATLAPLRPHTHLVFDLGGGSQLRYVDPRAFGVLFVTTPDAPELAHIGLDPLNGELTAKRFSARLAGHKMKLKAFLMDQRFVAGIGNIYSDEALFRARLHPFRMCDTLSPAEARRLYRAIREVLTAAIVHRGTSAEDAQYRDLHGATGQHSYFLEVYQRQGQACRHCGRTIQRARWTNRHSHFCPRCQV
ncbi:MAG: bifunctional DNA-formamidopyrimidine glycosylase/DNA-(apurinic or apyrimidinic site) lyase [Actinomycetota bacterium]